jgi:hypothetical protein
VADEGIQHRVGVGDLVLPVVRSDEKHPSLLAGERHDRPVPAA